jgi:hypothetical protein
MKIYSREVNQKDWISRSIKSARMVGYSPHLYTNDLEFAKNLDLDNITIVDDLYPYVWDSIKIQVLETRNDFNFFLSDNDVIYKSKIKFESDIDVFFDGFEINNWDWIYRDIINKIGKTDLFKSNPIWEFNKIPVMNLGILKINNNELKNLYIKEWKYAYNKLLDMIIHSSNMLITPVISQYLFTLICNNKKIKHTHFTKNGIWSDNNEYYNHYPGEIKFKQNSVLI